MEREQEVKTFLVNYQCDLCGDVVEYRQLLLTEPPKFKHYCKRCNEEYIFNQKYPYTRYKSIN